MSNFVKNTRYTNGTIAKTRADVSFLVLRKPLNLAEGEDDVTVTINQELLYRWDLISYKAYGIPTLWWVICEFNGINDPLFGLQLGQTLKIPSISRVLDAISKINK
jgi:hypothetical protein